MPIPFLADVAFNGFTLPFGIRYWDVLRVFGSIVLIGMIKTWCSGATNRSERTMHSKVVIITGGTTGIGAAIALDLAQRGAQIILLVRQSLSDPFLVDYISDLQTRSGNQLIYAEQVDLASTHSIRKFATQWIDNAPPRRLDMVILCAATFTPPGKARKVTAEGLEETWMVNYLANFHLLSILSPALRAQPPDRDVRVIFSTCASYIGSPPLLNGSEEGLDPKTWSAWAAYARSKLALMTFGLAFQSHLDAYIRPDKSPNNCRVIFVDPGFARTAGMRRWLSRGTLWGLALYLAFWHQAWLWLKSSEQGAQSFLYAAMEAGLGRGKGGRLVKECLEVDFARQDVRDEEVAKRLWEESDRLIERVEREEAVRRAVLKKAAEAEAVSKGHEMVQEKGADGVAGGVRVEDVTDSANGDVETKKLRSRRGRKAG